MIHATTSMRTWLVRAVAVVLAVAALLLTGPLSAPPVGAATAEVTIANMAFSPPTVQVETVENEPGFPGLHAHVNFAMRDPGVFHTVTFDDPSVARGSGPLATGQDYDAVLTKVGTFTYHCDIHPAMKGTVVVVRGSTAPSVSKPEEGSGNGAVFVIVALTVGLAAVGGVLLFWRRPRRSSS